MTRRLVVKVPGGATWYARRFDPKLGRWTRASTGMSSERQAERIARQWREEGQAIQAGLMPATLIQGERPIAEHVAEYIEAKKHSPRSVTSQHIAETQSRLERLIESTGWAKLSDVTVDRWTKAVADLAEKPNARRRGSDRTLSNASRNRFRATWKGFMRWAHQDGRMDHDALAKLPPWPALGYETFVRSALSFDEFRRLFQATLKGPERWGMSGRDRAMLYLVAVRTGFRANELRSLTPKSFKLDKDPPHVYLEARSSKNGKAAEQLLHADTAKAIGEWLATDGRSQRARVWPSIPKDTATMLREDLADAKVSLKRGDGVTMDFHCLRHTLATWCAQLGVSTASAQRLLRHSSQDLTMRHYTHLSNTDLAASTAALVRESFAPNLRADTQTPDDAGQRADGVVADAATSADAGKSVQPDELRTPDNARGGENVETAKKAGAGFEPANHGFAIRDGAPQTDFQSVTGQTFALDRENGAAAACAEFDHSRTTGRDLTRRARKARERADAGLAPDVAAAFAQIEELGSLVGGAR